MMKYKHPPIVKYKFWKIRYKKSGEETWHLVIDNILSLMDFNIIYGGYLGKEAIASSREKENHPTNTLQQYFQLGLKSFLQLQQEDFENKEKLLLKDKIILVNKNMGWFCFDSMLHSITSSKVSEYLVFPEYCEEDIKISQWSGGKHWYAKIGMKDVVIDGKMSWDTYDEAEEKAKLFLDILLKGGKP